MDTEGFPEPLACSSPVTLYFAAHQHPAFQHPFFPSRRDNSANPCRNGCADSEPYHGERAFPPYSQMDSSSSIRRDRRSDDTSWNISPCIRFDRCSDV